MAYQHFGVATAIAQRVMEFAAVELARTEDALAHLEEGRSYDLVVLCPYISGADREELIRRCGRGNPQPIAVNLLDGRRQGILELRDTGTGRPLDISKLNDDPSRAGAADLLTALGGPQVAPGGATAGA